MTATLWAVLLGAVVLVPVLGWCAQNPVRGPLAAYAGVVPFGSAVALPLPLPSPFDTLSTVLGLLSAAAVLVHLLGRAGAVTPLPRALGPLGLFLALTVAGWLWSVDQATTARAVAVLLSVLGLFVVVNLLTPSPSELTWLRGAVVIGGVGTGCWGILLLVTGGLGVTDGTQARFATAGGGGETADPNITAASLLLPLVLALSWLLQSPTRRQRCLAGLAVTAIGAGQLLTASRGGLLAGLISAAVLVLHLRAPGRAAAWLSATAAGVVALALLVPAGLVAHVQGSTSTGRADIWRVGLRACERYCLAGSGLGSFPSGYRQTLLASPELAGHGVLDYQAHDVWLALAVETGLLGVLLVLLALLLLVLDLLPLPQVQRGPPLAALVGVLAANLLLSNFSFKYVWLVLMFCTLTSAASRPATTRGGLPTGAPPQAVTA